MLTNLIQSIIDLGSAAMSMLPLCPFWAMQNSINNIVVSSEVLSFLSWFVPFEAILTIGFMWLQAILVWYLAKKSMRWAKLIR